MTTSVRDKWLMTLLPALFTGIGYVFFVMQPAARGLTGMRAQLERLRSSPPPDLASRRQALSAVNEKLNHQKQRAAALQAGAPKLPGLDAAAAAKRSEALRAFSNLLATKDLILVKSTQLQGESPKAIPAQAEALAKRLAEHAGTPRAEFWKFEIFGTYPDMLEAIRALSHSERFIVPVSIEMKPTTAKNGALDWSLTVWI